MSSYEDGLFIPVNSRRLLESKIKNKIIVISVISAAKLELLKNKTVLLS